MSSCIACEMGHEPRETFVMNVDIQMPVKGPTVTRQADFVRRAPGGIFAYVRDRVQGQIVYSVIYINISGYLWVRGDKSPISHLNLSRQSFVGWVHKRGTKFFARKADAAQPRCKGSSSLRKASSWLI